METINERVLAYGLAREVKLEELSEVTGGAGSLLTSAQTIRATGASGQGADMTYDMSWDW